MPTFKLNFGPPYTIPQNEVYALPASRMFLKSDTAVEVSQAVEGVFATLTGANTTGVETASNFVRCTTGTVIITIKKC